MALLSIQSALLICAGCAIWSLLRSIIRHSPLGNIPGLTSQSFILGNTSQLFSRYAWPIHKEFWNKYGSVFRVNGIFGSSMIYVYDPKALHHIVVKDQHIYEETPVFIDLSKIIFGEGLLGTFGERHRHQRKILNPVFHINHMKYMLPTFYHVTQKLRNGLANQLTGGHGDIDVLNWMTRTALELIGQGGLGHSFDSLDSDELNPFAENLKALNSTFIPLVFWLRLIPCETRIGTPAFRRRVLQLLPWKRVHRAVEIVDTLENMSKSILAHKKSLLAKGDVALEQQIGEGKDLMSVLLRENMHASSEDKMPEEELLGHMSTLVFAAMETTSGALAHTLQMLSEHPEVQDKLRAEIIHARGGREQLEYDELMSLPYLDSVCRETLRLHAPVTHVMRKTKQDVIMPFHSPIRGKDGTLLSEILVPRATYVVVGTIASNVNPVIWGPDAHEWKPERFLEPLPESVTAAHIPGIYSNLMTFLGGSRACIGFKFSQLEMKVVLSVLIENFKFSPSDKVIYWNWSDIQFPTVGKDSSRPTMPMRVALVQDA